jgi:hypothetical protein
MKTRREIPHLKEEGSSDEDAALTTLIAGH